MELVNPEREVSLSEVLSKLGGKLLVQLVGVIRTLVKSFLDIGAGVISQIKKLINTEIQIPVISWLWRKFSDNPLSILDTITLMLAVPTTVAFKAIHGKGPRHMPSRASLDESRKALHSAISDYEGSDQPYIYEQPATRMRLTAKVMVLNTVSIHSTLSTDADFKANPKAKVVADDQDDSTPQTPTTHITESGEDAPKTTIKNGDRGWWWKLIERIKKSRLMHAIFRWAEEHATILAIAYGMYNTGILIYEWWE